MEAGLCCQDVSAGMDSTQALERDIYIQDTNHCNQYNEYLL